MVYFTTNTYTLKREILNFSNKISKQLSKPERKFTADMTYGMLAAGSCFLTDVVKSGGYKFESLGIVRDGSESTSAKNVYKNRLPCNRSLCPYYRQSSGQYLFKSTFFS